MWRKETGRGNKGSTQDQHCPPNSSAQWDLNVTSHSNRLSKPTGTQTRKLVSALFVLGREAGLSCPSWMALLAVKSCDFSVLSRGCVCSMEGWLLLCLHPGKQYRAPVTSEKTKRSSTLGPGNTWLLFYMKNNVRIRFKFFWARPAWIVAAPTLIYRVILFKKWIFLF